VAYYARRWPKVLKLWALIGYDLEMPFTLAVEEGKCKGCGACVEVCPKGVFRLDRLGNERKSRALFLEECVQCTACVRQCPEHAIVAEPPIRTFGEI
jgi:NAD-dependent dihydropyrimidine dehydrogenase PreA subunit